jgi:hypothetical protein
MKGFRVLIAFSFCLIVMVMVAAGAWYESSCRSFLDYLPCPPWQHRLIIAVVFVAVFVFVCARMWMTDGIGETPPLRARLFGKVGRNMDGQTLLTYGGEVWGRSPYNNAWRAFFGG